MAFSYFIINILPYEIWFLFILISFLFVYNLTKIKRLFTNVRKRTWLIIAIIFFAALLIRMNILHSHLFYSDEQYYGAAAKNMLLYNKAGQSYYLSDNIIQFSKVKINIGWSLIISIAYFLFGVSDYVAINTASFIAALTIFPIFFFVYLLSRDEPLSLWSCLFMAMLPLHILWSGTSDNSLFAFFLTLLTLIAFIFFQRTGSWSAHLLGILLLGYSVQTKYEYVILIPGIIVSYFLFMKGSSSLKDKLNVIIVPWLAFLLIIPFYIPPFIETAKLFNNYPFLSGMDINSFFLDYSRNQNLVFILFLVVGAYLFFKSNIREAVYLMLMYLTFSIFYTLWSGQVSYKFFYINYLIISIFQSKGILFLRELVSKKRKVHGTLLLILIIGILLYSSYSFLVDYYDELGEEIHDEILSTIVPLKMYREFGDDCYIVTNERDALILSSGSMLKIIPAEKLMFVPKDFIRNAQCIKYFEGISCTDKSIAWRCDYALNFFNISIFRQYSLGDVRYSLYDLSYKAQKNTVLI